MFAWVIICFVFSLGMNSGLCSPYFASLNVDGKVALIAKMTKMTWSPFLGEMKPISPLFGSELVCDLL